MKQSHRFMILYTSVVFDIKWRDMAPQLMLFRRATSYVRWMHFPGFPPHVAFSCISTLYSFDSFPLHSAHNQKSNDATTMMPPSRYSLAPAAALMRFLCCWILLFLVLFQSSHAFTIQHQPSYTTHPRAAPHISSKHRHATLFSTTRTRHSRPAFTVPSTPNQHPVTLFATKNDNNSNNDNTQESSLTSELRLMSELESNKVLGGFLLSLAQVLESLTNGWALQYADLSPETEKTPVGQGFLATNVAYTLCGLLLVQNGNALLGVLTELASVASFAYHFSQLKLGKNQPLVRVALLVDYVVAAATLLAALVYIVQVGIFNVPLEGIVASVLAVVFLFLSWVWEEGLPYVINHGMWHLLGAYAGFMIGQAHYAGSAATTSSWWQ